MTIAIGKSNQKRGLFDVADDWLRRDRFFSLVVWSTFITLCVFRSWWLVNRNQVSWYTHGLASSYLEGCNF
jgi:photosystem II P680 reaction center D2 protein